MPTAPEREELVIVKMAATTYQRDYQRERRAELIRLGLCVVCSGVQAASHRTLCRSCGRAASERTKRWISRKQQSEARGETSPLLQ